MAIKPEPADWEQNILFVFIFNYSLFTMSNCLFSGSTYIWLYCGAVLLDKGPHVLRDW